MKVQQHSITYRRLRVSSLVVLAFIVTAALPRISGAVATDLSLQPPRNRTSMHGNGRR